MQLACMRATHVPLCIAACLPPLQNYAYELMRTKGEG